MAYVLQIFPQILDGLGITFGTFAVTLILALPLGALISLGRVSKNRALRSVFGVYTWVLPAISSVGIPVLVPGALGVLLGVFWGAKLIDWCMKRFEQQTYFAILGLIAGSILPILLNAGYTPGLHTLLSLIALIAGAAIAFWMSRMDGQQG